VSERTLVKVMTDGILLNEIQRDRDLTGYDTLIIDEAHERSLNVDFILGYLKQLLPRRPDLKVIVTSATIDTERFSQHFDGAPVVEVTGRTFPVEVRYRPLVDDEAGLERDQTQAICDAVAELWREGPAHGGSGDVLVFLSGEREIRDAGDALGRLDLPNTELLKLYARLSVAEQHRVFRPHAGRRIVLATNVAETSLTVPGIRYVIDTGNARISRYNRRTKVQRLPIEPVSQASANQRAGRCGRVAPGICIRLYPEDDYDARPEFTDAEILRTNLASVILQMAAIGLGDIAAFPFVDAPDARNISDGIALLEELGALEPADRSGHARLTPLGRRLARLPLDPRFARMVLEADANGCLREVMVIAAALSIQDPRERPADKQQLATELHGRFADPDSDFLAYLHLWEHIQERQAELSSSQFRRLCRNELLNYLRIREWQDVYGQLRQVLRSIGLRPNKEPGPADAIHLSLLAGLLSHIGMRTAEEKDYRGARDARFTIAPGSALSKKQPPWVMAAELVETNRLRARVVARMQPEWAERVGAHLVKRSYGEPQWDAARGSATVPERVTLYGLPIVSARPVPYGRVDPAGARDLFIQHALVERDWVSHHAFLEDNRKAINGVLALEDRVRRRDILVDDEDVFALYDDRLPDTIVSGRHFDRWWKTERATHPDLLTFTRSMLVRPDAGDVSPAAYPDVWQQAGVHLPITYRFDPGTEFDGVTVHIPLPLLAHVHGDDFAWQVPGLREAVVTALIRALPKQLRRSFVPVAEVAATVLQRVGPGDGPLVDTLARELGYLRGEPVPLDDLRLDRLPDHLLMSFVVTGEQGEPIVAGKDLAALRSMLRDEMRAVTAQLAPQVERSGLHDWSIGDLPRTVDGTWAGHTVTVHPALVDEGETVGVRLFANEAEQAAAMRAGTRRLLLLTLPSSTKSVQRLLRDDTKLFLARAQDATASEVLAQCVAAAVDRLVADNGGPAWDAAGFDRLRDAVRDDLVDTAVAAATAVGDVLVAAAEVEARVARLRTVPALAAAIADVRGQLGQLMRPGWIVTTGTRRLPDVARYVRGIEHRLERLQDAPARDLEAMLRVQRLEREYDELHEALPPSRKRDAWPIRWMLEELRISLFAQTLGTAQRVSEKRVSTEMDRVAAGE
ncbi:MAG: ATP-dependent helicase HrpA, partial [Acidimicrobiaceae bacterium]